LTRFWKTPKGLLTIIFAGLIALAAPGQGSAAMVGLASATIAAGLLDAVILRVRKKTWEYPSGAVLSAAIVVMVLRSQEPWYVTTITAVIGIFSKYLFRACGANIFNPAALAMVASYYLFHAGQSWWGAVTDVGGPAKLLLIAAGIYIANRVNKMPLVLTFLAAYFGFFTITAYATDPLPVAEIFRTPDLDAALYFAFFILTDPPTSPTRYRDQLVFGLIAAVISYASFERSGVVYFLLAGVLAANGWEAWQRTRRRTRRRTGQTPAMSPKRTPTSETAPRTAVSGYDG
jgi:Na+-translocating ferredoxin:NAD+ oxidoreductase RnfD subunit